MSYCTSASAISSSSSPLRKRGEVIADRAAPGADVTVPAGAPDYRFAFFTGATFPVFQDDFENGDEGWTHGGAGDEWEVGIPNGGGGDPEDAFSGTHVLGTDVGGYYNSDASSFVESPVIDCRGCTGARLRLRRWLSIEDGNYDQARILVDGVEIWANPVANSWNGPPVRDPHWSYEDYDISAIADGEKVVVRFELASDQGLEFGGWNIDDMEVVSLEEPTANGGDGGGKNPWSCDVSSTSAGLPGLGTVLAALAMFVRRRRGS